MPKDATRVRYAEGQRIRAADLRAEQEYLIALEQRHNLGQHAPGIVLGLEEMQPGVAVDEDGRVLTLTAAAHAVPNGCIDTWLVRCDTPPRGRCQSGRVHEHVRVVTVPATRGEPESPPLPGAIYLGRTNCNEPRDRVYTSLRAATVTDPARRAIMQVGPAHGRDRNGFLVSTIDEKGALQARVAIDRFGTNRLDGTVSITGYRAWTALVLSDTETLRIYARHPGREGEGIEVQVRPEDPDALRFVFFEGRRKSDDELVLRQGGGREKAIEEFRSDLVEVVLEKNRLRRPLSLGAVFLKLDNIIFKQQQDQQAPAGPYKKSVDRTLRMRGGNVDIAPWPARGEDDVEPLRGCVSSLAEEGTFGPRAVNVSFVALSEAPKIPPVRGMWSVRAGTAAELIEELRLDLGPKDDNDTTSRLFLGRVRTSGQQQTLERELAIHGNNFVDTYEMVVEGDIRVAPIKADYTDPNFTALLVRGWMDGLAAAIQATAEVELAFVELPEFIRAGKPWSYKVTIFNDMNRELVAARLLETLVVTGVAAPFARTVSPQLRVPAKTTLDLVTLDHEAGEIPAGMLSIAVRVTGTAGNLPWWKELRTTTPIPVVATPAIEVSDIPESVPRDQEFAVSFAIRNVDAVRSVTIDEVTLTENGVVVQTWANDVVLAPQEVRTFTRPAHAGVQNPVEFRVEATFKWSDTAPDDAFQVKTTRVSTDLMADIEVDEPIDPDDWSYRLAVRNASDQRITLTSAQQSVFNEDDDLLIYEGEVSLPDDLVLEPREERLLEIDGDDLEGAPAIRIVLRIRYTRDDEQTFEVEAEREGIDVT